MGKRQSQAVPQNSVSREGKADGLDTSSNRTVPHPPPAPSPSVVNNQKLVLFCGSDNSFILKEKNTVFIQQNLYNIIVLFNIKIATHPPSTVPALQVIRPFCSSCTTGSYCVLWTNEK